MLWAPVGVLVAVDLVRRIRCGERARILARKYWWYVLASLLLLVEMMLQLQNPVISNQATRPDLDVLARQFVWASPFSYLGMFGDIGIFIAGALFFLALLIGVIVVSRNREMRPTVRQGLLLAVAASFLAPALIGSANRFMMTYIVAPIVVASFTFAQPHSKRNLNSPLLCLTVAFFMVIALWVQRDPYGSGWVDEPRFSEAARDLQSALGPGDCWTAHEYFLSSPLYRYAKLPEPFLPLSTDELDDFLRIRRRDRACFLFINKKFISQVSGLENGELIGSYAGIDLIRLPPAQR